MASRLDMTTRQRDATSVMKPRAARGGMVEVPTVLVAVALYGGWLAATFWHRAIPAPLLAILGGWLVAWHGSLQHETIHGHPFRSRMLNAALGFPPLALWLPYALYRRSHIAHHGSASPTDPLLDPESRYVRHRSGMAAIVAQAQATLLGRLLLGPPIAAATLFIEEARRLATTPGAAACDWLPHLAAVALLCGWLDWVGFGIGRYLLLFVYPGMALTLLRSFAEHRADSTAPGRAATVERGGVFAILFLNNNLHAAHHDRPDLAWYRLPAHHRKHRERLVGDGTGAHRSYGSVVKRFALRRHHLLVHPAHDAGTR